MTDKYPSLPVPHLPRGGFPDLFTADQMRAYVDADRASRPAPATVGEIGDADLQKVWYDCGLGKEWDMPACESTLRFGRAIFALRPAAADVPAVEQETPVDDKSHPRFMAGYDAGFKDGRFSATQNTDLATPPAKAPAEAGSGQGDRYWTQPAESLMGIAMRQLKDESRWAEIRDLNAGSFPDMGPHDYYPVGTALRMPALAAPASQAALSPRAGEDAGLLADAERWRELMNIPGARKRIWNHVLDSDQREASSDIEAAIDALRAARQQKGDA